VVKNLAAAPNRVGVLPSEDAVRVVDRAGLLLVVVRGGAGRLVRGCVGTVAVKVARRVAAEALSAARSTTTTSGNWSWGHY